MPNLKKLKGKQTISAACLFEVKYPARILRDTGRGLNEILLRKAT